MPGGHSHRAGALRQSNKKNKRSKTSKRSLNRVAGGKIAHNGSIRQNSSQARHATHRNGASSNNKAKRQLLAKQRRDLQRKKQIDAKRLGMGGTLTDVHNNLSLKLNGGNTSGGGEPVPKVIGVISLSADNDDQAQMWETQFQHFLQTNADPKTSTSTTFQFSQYKKHAITVLTNSKSFASHYQHQISFNGGQKKHNGTADSMIMGALDLCRVCDLIVFTINGDIVHENVIAHHQHQHQHQQQSRPSSNHSVHTHTLTHKSTSANTTTDICDELFISERGEDILSACKAQGLPTVLTVLTHSSDMLSSVSLGGISSIQPPPPLNHREKAKIQKRRNEMKRFGQRLTVSEFGEDARFMDIPLPSVSSTISDRHLSGMIVQADDNHSIMDEDNANANANVGNNDNNNDTAMEHDNQNNNTHVNEASTLALIRFLCAGAASPPKWVDQMPRPYLVTAAIASPASSDIKSVFGSSQCGHTYNPATKELQITGHVRGKAPLSVYNLIHIPMLGTFPVSQIQVSSNNNNDANDAMGQNNSINTILPTNKEDYQESMEMFATPDALEGEQNLIGFEDHPNDDFDGGDDDDDDDDGEQEEPMARPAGWSDYQSAWLDGVDADQNDQDVDFGELAKSLNAKKSSSNKDDDLTMDGMGYDMDDEEDDEDEDALEQKRLRRKEDLEFPDEVEVERDELASDRFARYRSLKSFRKSYWDPKENLPESYAHIYHFASFKNTQKDVLGDQQDLVDSLLKKYEKEKKLKLNEADANETKMTDASMDNNDEDSDEEDLELMNGCIFPGSFVSITVTNVPPNLYQSQISPNAPISAVSLLPHENKVSVLHMGITSRSDAKIPNPAADQKTSTGATVVTMSNPKDDPIKSKDTVIFRCGWRTWQGRPVFSQNNLNSDKHKLERFLPPRGAFLAASVFGPVCYSPCPVLCFSKKGNLAAVGSVMGADADRVVIKRIILTGYPTRVHKRHATVKYMFYNPEDVKWFKPAGLTTKHGLQGNIMESVGDHGTMKCLFNQPVKQHDTICLPLYKRIFPKFAPQTIEDADGNTVVKDLVIL